MGAWARPGRKRKAAAPEEEAELILPPPEYPELKDLPPGKRLTALAGLASAARKRAVAATEEGCIAFAMSNLREAQRLDGAWRTLRDWLEIQPAPEEDDWRSKAIAELEALEDIEMLMAREAAGLVEAPAKTAAQIEEAELVAAVRAAFAAQPGWTEAESIDAELGIFMEVMRLKEERKKWLCLPGRTPPPIVVHLPPRRDVQGAEAGEPARAYEPFPVVLAPGLRERGGG